MSGPEDVVVPAQAAEADGPGISGAPGHLDAERDDELVGALGELSRLLLDEEDLAATLARVAGLAARVIPGCRSAGVTLVAGERASTAAYTDERTLEVDAGQYAVGDGPCLTAIRERRMVIADFAEASEQWPAFWQAAVAVGIRSFLAAPLTVRGEGIGALNLYGTSPGGFAPVDEALVALFAGQASVALANAQLYRDAVTLGNQLRTAIASRAVIEQAKGVVMARRSVREDAAFELLREASMRGNRKLRDVAREVVESTTQRRPVR